MTLSWGIRDGTERGGGERFVTQGRSKPWKSGGVYFRLFRLALLSNLGSLWLTMTTCNSCTFSFPGQRDLSLRNILSNAKLDPSKMEPYEKNKLYIITGVVYSEKMHIDGKREENDVMGAQLKILPRVHWLSRLAQFKADVSWVSICRLVLFRYAFIR